MSAAVGDNEAAVRRFLASAGLTTVDDPRAAQAVSAAAALDAGWDPSTSRELRQLRRELAEYVAARVPAPKPPEGESAGAAPVSIVDRLKRRPAGA